MHRELGREVVGVVADNKDVGLDQNTWPTMFVPQAQCPDDFTTYSNSAFLAAWIVRTAVPLRVANVARLAAEVDPTQPVVDVKPMTTIIQDSVGPSRFYGMLIAAFAGLALVLASVGLYSVIAYSVAQRTHEIGIRMALGARSGDVLRMVVGEGLGLAAVGTVIGLGLALALTRLLRSLLFEVKPGDPMTLAAVVLGLLAVSLLASYIPARRAASVDPMVALRHD